MTNQETSKSPFEGILLVDKPRNRTSFSLVAALRRCLHVQKIGHAGTLDPFATGLMVMLVGKKYTQMSMKFLQSDKEYVAEVKLGVETDTYDCDGQVVASSELIPTKEDILKALEQFQGEVQQIPPMFSAKKLNGKKLYDLARKGVSVEREPVTVYLETQFLNYEYPFLHLKVKCSKGTYIRSIAQDLGRLLGCGAHLSALQRTRSGNFCLDNRVVSGDLIFSPDCKGEALSQFLITHEKIASIA